MYTQTPPRHTDPLAGTITELAVPEMLNPIKLFLWDNPTQETWDSLFIDGTYTKKEGDKEVEVSKNWMQEVILSAENFEGSALHTLVSGLGELSTAEKSPATPPEPTPTEPTPPAAGIVDPLASLGI